MIIFSLVDIMLDGSCKSSGRVHGEGSIAHSGVDNSEQLIFSWWSMFNNLCFLTAGTQVSNLPFRIFQNSIIPYQLSVSLNHCQ